MGSTLPRETQVGAEGVDTCVTLFISTSFYCNLFFNLILQLTLSPSCTAASAESFWNEPFTPSSSRRVTRKQTNARRTLGEAVKLEQQLLFTNNKYSVNLFFSFSNVLREFSSALEFLQLLNSCTEESPSPLPPFSTPPSHTITTGTTGFHGFHCCRLSVSHLRLQFIRLSKTLASVFIRSSSCHMTRHTVSIYLSSYFSTMKNLNSPASHKAHMII